MLRHAITKPLDVLSAFWNTPGNVRDTIVKRQYWPQMFGPLLALPLLAPLWLVPALPILAEHMLSERIQQHTIVFQYTALVLPSVSVAAVLGLAGLVRRASRPNPAREPNARPPAPAWAPTLAMLMVAAGLLAQWLWGGVFGTGQWQDVVHNEEIWPDSLERTMRPYRDRMMARIPPDGAVVAGFEFLSHLATRSDLHSMHHVLSGEYTYSDQPYPLPKNVTAVVGDMTGQIPYMDFHSGERLRAIAAERGLEPAAAVGGTIEMLPGVTDSVEFYRIGERYDHPRLDLLADGQMLFLGAVRLDSLVSPGQVLRIKSYWKRVAPGNRSYLSQAWLLRRGGAGEVYGRARMLCYGLLLVPEWPLDSIVSETYHLLIPSDAPPGNYRPVFRLIAVDSLGKQALPMVRVGNVVEPMNLAGLGDVTITAEKKR
jgi:hypothetical protein